MDKETRKKLKELKIYVVAPMDDKGDVNIIDDVKKASDLSVTIKLRN